MFWESKRNIKKVLICNMVITITNTLSIDYMSINTFLY
nr:MAG TPA_asm: hypothetical protein [Caudoviricetes sp.]